jgi:hypothetical protein
VLEPAARNSAGGRDDKSKQFLKTMIILSLLLL